MHNPTLCLMLCWVVIIYASSYCENLKNDELMMLYALLKEYVFCLWLA
jgi:hypothetical protein